jgi:methylmalonyl-CoA mutase
MPDADVIPLADAFAPASREQWLALVEKTLKGADVGTLTTRTADGLPIEPLYTAESAATASPARPVFSGDQQRPWDLRSPVSHPDPTRANREALEELEGGAASLLVRGDPRDLEQVLEGVVLDLAPVALDAGWAGPEAARRLADLAKGGPQAQLAFHLDPLGAFAEQGRSPGPVEAHLEQAARMAAGFAETYPRASFFLASGQVVHEAGGTEAQELGFAVACAVAYARALTEAGLPVQAAFERVTLGLAADETYFTTIAKLRAARLLWAKLTGACGAASPAVIEARSSRRMLSRLDAWNNMLRLTAAGFGAGLGGANAVLLEPFTTPLGAPTPFARRQARNTQLVLMEEANLGRVADPAGGAWFIETLTDQLARAAWAVFQDIEGRGGVVDALSSGHIAESVTAAREARQADYAEGRAKIIGVTLFPNPDAPPPATEAQGAPEPDRPAPDEALPGGDSVAPPLSPIRWSQPFEEAAHGR